MILPIFMIFMDSTSASTMQSSNPTPGYVSKGIEIKILKRYLHSHVHYNTIHISHVMETM